MLPKVRYDKVGIQMITTANRLQGIDALKGVAIALVVIGHVIQYRALNGDFFSHTYTFIYLFHMPLFFFISGININMKHYSGVSFRKNIRRLSIPWIFWSAFVFLFSLNRAAEFNSFESLFYLYWFFPVLIICHVIIFLSVWVSQFVRLNLSFPVASGVTFGFLYQSDYLFSLTAFHFVFMTAGIYSKTLYSMLPLSEGVIADWRAIVVILAMFFLAYWIFDGLFSNALDRLVFSMPLLLLLGFFCCQPAFKSFEWIESLGRYSLEIYTTHIAVIFLLKPFLDVGGVPAFVDFLLSSLILCLVTFIIVRGVKSLRVGEFIYGK